MGYPLIFDILNAVVGIAVVNPPETLPPPMTRQEVLAQKLYADDCMTTRDGIELTCQAAFEQDLKRSDEIEARNKKAKDVRVSK